MKKEMIMGLLVGLLVFSAPGITIATMIDTTTPPADPGLAFNPFGETNTATYGQTFTAPSNSVLDNFSLYLEYDGSPNPVNFRAYVYEWNGSMATGPTLFSSSDQTFNGSPLGSPVEFNFATGGISLEGGKTYVAFLSASLMFDGLLDIAMMPYSGASLSSNPYPGGQFVYYNNGSNFSLLTTTSWDGANDYTLSDVWFKASLSEPIPEPTTMLLLGTGLVGVAGAARRKKKNQA